ncbi:MAG: metal ABC transporter permease [Chlamydiia bacterium]|nr:metal ABC transporter permease [Chlamydiia bacterium]
MRAAMTALLIDPFFLTAVAASLLASIASGTIGTYVIVKRIAFIAGSISHSVLGGMGLCLWLKRTLDWHWLSPLFGAFAAAIGAALLIGYIHLRYREREDAIIASVWSTGMAIGVIFLAMTPGTNVELVNYLFGNILWIRSEDLWLLAGLDLFLISAIALYYRRFLMLCFDEEQALLQGVPVRRLYLLLLSLVAISIVLLIQIIGTILLIALLAIPAMTAALFTRRLFTMMLGASLFSILYSLSGLFASYFLDWPPGATIALVAALGYLGLLPYRRSLLPNR